MARTRSPATDPGSPRGGYVLIEAVAALAIALLLLAFAYPLVAGGTTPSRLLALASSSASLLREARSAAMASGRPVAARFDPAARRLGAGTNALTIPRDVAFSLTAGGNCRTGDGEAAVLFRPDGSGCGGVLRFAAGGQVLRTRVDWTDGHVDIVRGG